jgi:hypothetical protein
LPSASKVIFVWIKSNTYASKELLSFSDALADVAVQAADLAEDSWTGAAPTRVGKSTKTAKKSATENLGPISISPEPVTSRDNNPDRRAMKISSDAGLRVNHPIATERRSQKHSVRCHKSIILIAMNGRKMRTKSE